MDVLRPPSRPTPERPGAPGPMPAVRFAHGHQATTVVFWCSVALVVFLPVQSAFAASTPGTGVFEALVRWAPVIIEGFGLNLFMSFMAIALGTSAGALLGIAQVSSSRWVRRTAWMTTETFRNAPTLVLLFFCMFLLPFQLQICGTTIPLPPWVKAILGLSLSTLAYVSEIVRGGLQSIPSTQWEAAESLAFSRSDILRLIIVPQCVKQMLPPWMNVYAILIMSTPLSSILGVNEGLTLTRAAISSEGRPELLAPFYLFLLALFFVYSYPISVWTIRLERRYAVKS
jgi:polar amino acid transport system permease protein